jgi:hypothetical protein
MDAKLREELVQRMIKEQELRMALIDKPNDQELIQRMVNGDQQNTAWLMPILQQHGWPGTSLVGADGAQAVFLIVQHSPSHEFQKQCLVWLDQAVQAGEADVKNLAYLTDRVRLRDGKRQVYGTQGEYRPNGRIEPAPIEDEEYVDERRRAAGLVPIADYFQQINESYKTQSG